MVREGRDTGILGLFGYMIIITVNSFINLANNQPIDPPFVSRLTQHRSQKPIAAVLQWTSVSHHCIPGTETTVTDSWLL
jgi:hypothetical protein